jgi:hypothetical protein
MILSNFNLRRGNTNVKLQHQRESIANSRFLIDFQNFDYGFPRLNYRSTLTPFIFFIYNFDELLNFRVKYCVNLLYRKNLNLTNFREYNRKAEFLERERNKSLL